MPTDGEILGRTLLIYGVVFGAALVLTFAVPKARWGRDMKAATLSWLVIFAVLLGADWLGSIGVAVLAGVLGLLAFGEFLKLTGTSSPAGLAAGAVAVAAGAWAAAGGRGWFWLLPGLAGPVFLFAHVVTRSYGGTLRVAPTWLFGFVHWAWLMLHLALIRTLPGGFGYLVLLGSMIALNDNCAYVVGRLFGGRSPKLAPAISPGKTWVGFLGGAAATFLCVFVFRYTAPALSVPSLLLVAGVLSVAIPLGDLAESAMKRDAAVKDAGSWIPGHGGVMDRFDSWVVAAPALYYYLLLAGG